MRRVSQHPSHLLRVQSRGATRRRGRSKERGDAVRAPVAFGFELLATEGHGDTRANVVAKRHRAKKVRAADVKLLSGGERGGNHCATGMRLRGRMRIVGDRKSVV